MESARPASGVRYVLVRADDDDGAAVYRGFAHLPSEDVAVEVRVALEGGATRARSDAHPDAATFEKAAAALVRAATKAPLAAGAALPRKVTRWRG